MSDVKKTPIAALIPRASVASGDAEEEIIDAEFEIIEEKPRWWEFRKRKWKFPKIKFPKFGKIKGVGFLIPFIILVIAIDSVINNIHWPSALSPWFWIALVVILGLVAFTLSRKKGGAAAAAGSAPTASFAARTTASAALILGMAFVLFMIVGLGFAAWSALHPNKSATKVAYAAVPVLTEPVPAHLLFVVKNEWSDPIKIWPGMCSAWQKQDSVAYEMKDQDGNTMIYPDTMKASSKLEFKDSTGAIVKFVSRGDDGLFRWPGALRSFRVRTLGPDSLGFDVERHYR